MSGSGKRVPKAAKPIFEPRPTFRIEVGEAGQNWAALEALMKRATPIRDRIVANLGMIKAAAAACLNDKADEHSHQHANRALSAAEFVEEHLGKLTEHAQLVVRSAMVAARMHAEYQANIELGPAVDQALRSNSAMPKASAAANAKRRREADEAAMAGFRAWLTEVRRKRFTTDGSLNVVMALKVYCAPNNVCPVPANTAKRLRRLMREGQLS